MVSENVEEQQVFSTSDIGLIQFSKYKVPAIYKQLKIKLLQTGLDHNESDVYISLLENGQQKISEITSKVGFDRTYAYHLICGLQNKGLVTASFKHPVQFRAVNPEKALKILSKCKRNTPKEKQEHLANSLARLSGIISIMNNSQKSNLVMLDIDEAYSKAKEMQINSKHEILILAHTDDITALSDCGFMNALQSQLQTGIDVKILVPSDQSLINGFQNLDGSVRCMEQGILEPFSFIIVDNSQMLVIDRGLRNNKEPRVVWTTFEPFISALYFLFSDLWESSSIN